MVGEQFGKDVRATWIELRRNRVQRYTGRMLVKRQRHGPAPGINDTHLIAYKLFEDGSE